MNGTKKSLRRAFAFVTLASFTAFSLISVAQPKKPTTTTKPKHAVTKPAAKPAPKPMTPDEDTHDAGPGSGTTTATAAHEERVAARGGDGGTAAVVDQKTVDGGGRVFRFGEVEVEGRLKSPQIVYFLRRVRAEFSAGDLGHRSFLREMDETRSDPAF